jgi:hypothetical protein
MMRELTQPELDKLLGDFFVCPFCESEEWYEGPSGGMSQNVYCANEECGAGFNVMGPKPVNVGGQLILPPKGGDPGPVLTLVQPTVDEPEVRLPWWKRLFAHRHEP